MPSPPLHNHSVHNLTESRNTIHTHSQIAIFKTTPAIVFPNPQLGSFIASVRGSLYTTLRQLIAVFRFRLSGFGVAFLAKEVLYA